MAHAVHNHPSFWGPITSNVDWCESNYSHTPFVAEFWNTLSSMSMIYWGVVGAIYCTQMKTEFRFILAFIFLGIVGAGSVAFHATLLYSCQLLDELPMILGSLVFTYIALNLTDGESKQASYGDSWRNRALIVSLILYGMLTTILMAVWTHSPVPMNVSYIAMIMLIVGRTYMIFSKTPDSNIAFYYKFSVGCYIFGCACWLTEKFFCGHFEATRYLHAIWHLGAGFGTYTFVMWTVYVSLVSQGKKPRIVWKYFTPILAPNAKYMY
jgi:dihydroceramidase